MSLAGSNPPSPTAETRRSPGLGALARYFLRLGSIGFGGPIALAGAMQRDLVERRGWISAQEYLDGLALAQLMPGPLAAQLAIYIGWVRARVLGATVVAIAFVLPSFAMVWALAALYLHSGGMPWVADVFYGVGPLVIAIIGRGAAKLARMTLRANALLWLIFGINAAATAWTGREEVWSILAGGLVVLAIRSRAPRIADPRWLPAIALGSWLVTGAHGPANAETLARIVSYFTQAGALVFGSGLAIVPFLKSGVVDGFHWLDERQFMDAIAIGMITPGPVVITVAFIGQLVAGPIGALLATLAVFVPCWLLVVLPAPHFARVARSERLRHFVQGVTAGAAGAIAGAVVVLGMRAIVDPFTAVLAVAGLLAMMRWPKVPEPAWILLAGVAGLLARRG